MMVKYNIKINNGIAPLTSLFQ